MVSRTTPPIQAALAAPNWWPATIQPKTMGASRSPKASVVRRSVGGTVAIQSSPKKIANSDRL
ncbi:Uncharacterised protein [Bordetella pertussis]|nr:Uncharacterised protein [Bordetella pertussis]